MTDVDFSSKARMKLSGLVNQGTREVSNLIRREIELARRSSAIPRSRPPRARASRAGGRGGSPGRGVRLHRRVAGPRQADGAARPPRSSPRPTAVPPCMLASRARTELERVQGAPRTIATLEELTPGGD